MTHLVKIIQCEPGIDKDSTTFSTKSYIDAEWMRFYGKEGRPYKIKGYKLIDETNEIVRTLNMIERTGGGVDIYYGTSSSLFVRNFTSQGIPGNYFDRTPIGFIPDVNNSWSFDQVTVLNPNETYDSYIVATASPNLDNLNSSSIRTVFWGNIKDETPLVPLISDTATVVLNSGTQVFVSSPTVTANSFIATSINTPVGTPGIPYVSDTMILPGIGFYVNSQGGTGDNSVISYQIREKETNIRDTITLVAGTLTVTTPLVRDDSIIYLSFNTPDAVNAGKIYVDSIVPGTSFTIKSSNVLDTSKINYSLVQFPNIFEGKATLVPTLGGSEVTVNIGGMDGLNIFNTSLVFVSFNSLAGTPGNIYAASSNIIPQTSFKIKSSSATDASVVNYRIYNYPTTSGGVVSVAGGVFLFLYGEDGTIQWCDRGRPNVFPSDNKVQLAPNKIIQGLEIRAGGNYGVLFWSLNTLARGIYAPTPTNVNAFSFDIIEPSISVLSVDGIVQHQSQFFWCGRDMFYKYDGAVSRIENNELTLFFFENYNKNAAPKIYGLVDPMFSEVSWYFPVFPSTENTHKITYHMNYNKWSLNTIPRSTGIPSTTTFAWPIMSANIPLNGKYGVYLHEYGWDYQDYHNLYAIPSYFVTRSFWFAEDNPSMDLNMRIRRIEIDFKFEGQMSLTLLKRQSPNDPFEESVAYYFTPDNKIINMDEQAGIINFKFESNIVGGNYLMGNIIIQYEPGDPRIPD